MFLIELYRFVLFANGEDEHILDIGIRTQVKFCAAVIDVEPATAFAKQGQLTVLDRSQRTTMGQLIFCKLSKQGMRFRSLSTLGRSVVEAVSFCFSIYSEIQYAAFPL